MRIEEIAGIVREHFLFALVIVLFLAIVFFLALFILNRKFPGFKEKF